MPNMIQKKHSSSNKSKIITFTPILYIIVTIIGIISVIELLIIKENIYQNVFNISHIGIMDLIVGFVIRLAISIPLSYILYLLVIDYNKRKEAR